MQSNIYQMAYSRIIFLYVWGFPWCSFGGFRVSSSLNSSGAPACGRTWCYLGIAWLLADALCKLVQSVALTELQDLFDHLSSVWHSPRQDTLVYSSVKLQNIDSNLALLCCHSCGRDLDWIPMKEPYSQHFCAVKVQLNSTREERMHLN